MAKQVTPTPAPQTQRTPGPWYVGGTDDSYIRPWPRSVVGGVPIASFFHRFNDDEEAGTGSVDQKRANAKANAAFIVLAVNSHDDLVAACRLALAKLESLNEEHNQTGQALTDILTRLTGAAHAK